MLVTMLVSHAGDDADGATWPQHDEDVESCWQRCYRVMLATVLPGRHDRGAMYMSSHVGDNAVESCWRLCCLGDLGTVRCRC
jgi:hypothetical protein